MADERDRIAALYREHMPVACALGAAVCGDSATGEDVAQDAFLKCAGRLSRLHDPQRFRSYLLRTVVRTGIDRQRRMESERSAWSRTPTSASPVQPAEPVAADLLDALRGLPPRQRAAIAARYLLDWTEHDTARALGCAPGTVKSLTSRGLAALRLSLAATSQEDSHER